MISLFVSSLTSFVEFVPRLSGALFGQIPASFKQSLEYGLGLVFMIGFVWGVVNIWGGADKMKRGDPDGKMGIFSGIIIAGAAAIMSAFYFFFGMSGGALTPQF